MKRTTTPWLLALIVSLPAASLLAHHSLASYDTTTAVHVKGTIVQVHLINPHSILLLESTNTDGTRQRWAVEGPSVLQLYRTSVPKDFLKAGDVVEVCGYLPKEHVVWQMGSTDPSVQSLSGRLLNGESLVLADGSEHSWGDYGVHKCFTPGYRDQHKTP
jgi:hypothetical protein